MIIHYDSKDFQVSLSMTEQEMHQPHEKIPYHVLGFDGAAYFPLPISIGIKCILERYLEESCQDFSAVLERCDAIRKDLDRTLQVLTRTNGWFALSFAQRTAGLSENYFSEWLKETTGCTNDGDFISRFDYCDEKLALRYRIDKDEILIYLGNGTDMLELRRFSPHDPEVFRKQCDQAWFIAADALYVLYQEDMCVSLNDQGVLKNPLYKQIKQAYAEKFQT